LRERGDVCCPGNGGKAFERGEKVPRPWFKWAPG
jgi:hypothetical protein